MTKTTTTLMTTILAALTLTACVPAGDGEDTTGGQDAEADAQTETFRAGLVTPEDIEMTSSISANGAVSQGLNDLPSNIAWMTADAIVGTNTFLKAHFEMMQNIVSLRPTLAEEDRRVWEGTWRGVFLQVTVERSDAPRGTRFDYSMRARQGDDADAELVTLLDGQITRIETRPNLEKQGWGVARFNFTNVNTFFPEEHPTTGQARVAFRRVGNVRQVRVRMYDVVPPNDPQFPRVAAYEYVLLPDDAGSLKWFSRSDVMKDGAPLEDVAIHSRWKADRAGLGAGLVTGGSLNVNGTPVDYWSLGECWNDRLINVFARSAIEGWSRDFGTVEMCRESLEDVEVPTVDENLPVEDPEIPGVHPQETELTGE